MTPSSYEAHITIEPVFGESFDTFATIAKNFGFRPAELLLQKQRLSTPERSSKDSFCTGHGTEYDEVKLRTTVLVERLKEYGFEVWRYKIEGILLDVRTPPLVKIKTENGGTA